MSRTLAVPYNIRSHAAALAEGLSYDDRVHLRVKENRLTGDFFFIKFIGNHEGILVHTRCDRIIRFMG